MKMKKFAGLLLAVAVMGSLVGCGTQNKDAAVDNTGTENVEASAAESSTPNETGVAELSGSVTMAGSTSMEKLCSAVAESFMAIHPGVTISPEFTGSSAGVEAVMAGNVDIGNSSRALKDAEKEAGAVENIVAIDGIAVIVDKANTMTELSKEDLIKIYTGEVKNWKDLGGADQAIVVVGREAGSGTRGAFEEILEVADQCAYANELDSTGAVMAKISSTPGAVGYVSLDVVDDTVIALSLDGVAPSVENIKGGSYFLSRPFVMATKGEIAQQNETVQALFAYLASAEGKQVIEAVGLITVD